MSQTHVQIEVLRAALRCARHRRRADRAALLVRVDCSEAELDAALAALARRGLLRSAHGGSLTLEGFAIAVASLPRARAMAAPARARTAA